MLSREELNNLISVLVSENDEDVKLGIGIYNDSNLSKRQKRILVQGLRELGKGRWQTSIRNGIFRIYRGQFDLKLPNHLIILGSIDRI